MSDRLLNFFEELNKNGNLIPTLIIILLVIVSILSFLGILISKLIQFLKKMKRINLPGGASVDINDEGNPKEVEIDKDTLLPKGSKIDVGPLVSLIQNVVNSAITNGYKNCQIRQQLFENQMKSIYNNIEVVKGYILGDYLQSGGLNQEIVDVFLNYVLEDKVVSPLREICIADQLTKKSKDMFIESSRIIIDNSFVGVQNELRKLINISKSTKESPSSGVKFEIEDHLLLKALENHKSTLREKILDALNKTYDEAITQFEYLKEQNDASNKAITLLVLQYVSTTDKDKIPENWVLKNNEVPPNHVITGD